MYTTQTTVALCRIVDVVDWLSGAVEKQNGSWKLYWVKIWKEFQPTNFQHEVDEFWKLNVG